jgi:dolichol-phosphate mannosyltransferase
LRPIADFNNNLLYSDSVAEICKESDENNGIIDANDASKISSYLQTKKTELKASIIIPVHNQEEKISTTLTKVKHVLSLVFLDFELIVVNDGSLDNTLEVLKKEEQKSDSHLHVVSYMPNRGKGYAVRRGVMESRGDLVLYIDGDLEVSPEAIKDFVRELENYDLVIASKAHPLSEINAPILRKFLSRAFNLLVRTIVDIPLKDTQAGLKAGNGGTLRIIFKNMLVNRFAFDVEMLTVATFLNLKIKEMPITVNSNHGFMKAREIVRMFIDVTAISYRYRIKKWYQRQIPLTLDE